jgi:N-acetylmuramoyl-L-alanine amidase
MTQKNRRFYIFSILLILFGFSLILAGQVFAQDHIGKINTAKANVRQGAGTSYPLAFQLSENQQVTIKESKEGWLLVETNKGKGWIAAWLVDAPTLPDSGREVLVTGDVVNIRKEPSTQSARVTQVKKGDKLEIIGQEGEWYEINTKNGQRGWVAGWLVSFKTSSNTPSNTPNPTPNTPTPNTPSTNNPPVNSQEQVVLVTGSVVNIRQGPSISHPVISQVKGGTELKVISQQGDWLNIRLNNGSQGWIAQWLTVNKNNHPLPQPGPYFNEYNLNLDNDCIMKLNNLGDKLKISIAGVEDNQYQIGQTTDGIKLIVELKTTQNLKSLVQPMDNWGVKEIKVENKAVMITFSKNFKYTAKYNQASKSLEVDITYPTEQLVPVRQIKLSPMESQAVLQIAAARKIEYSTQASEPNKIVIDLPQSSLQLNSQEELEQRASFGPIRRVSSRQLSPDTVRIEAELTPGALYQVSQQDDYIVVGARLLNGGSLKGKTIVIDPGHGSIQPGGWTDPGTSGRQSGTAERDINLAIALKLRDMLTQQGANVVMTHSTGRTYLTLAGRAALANDINADIFVSIHCNSHNNSAIQGSMTFYYAPTWHSELSSQRWLRQRLALYIQEEMVSYGGRPNLGIKEESFAVLRETKVPSVLVETAFMSNTTEDALLNTDAFRTKIAQGIFKGIERYFQSL